MWTPFGSDPKPEGGSSSSELLSDPFDDPFDDDTDGDTSFGRLPDPAPREVIHERPPVQQQQQPSSMRLPIGVATPVPKVKTAAERALLHSGTLIRPSVSERGMRQTGLAYLAGGVLGVMCGLGHATGSLFTTPCAPAMLPNRYMNSQAKFTPRMSAGSGLVALAITVTESVLEHADADLWVDYIGAARKDEYPFVYAGILVGVIGRLSKVASMRKAGVGRAAQISTLLASATLGGAFGYSGAFLGFFN